MCVCGRRTTQLEDQRTQPFFRGCHLVQQQELSLRHGNEKLRVHFDRLTMSPLAAGQQVMSGAAVGARPLTPLDVTRS